MVVQVAMVAAAVALALLTQLHQLVAAQVVASEVMVLERTPIQLKET
jgi:hypothetical protein